MSCLSLKKQLGGDQIHESQRKRIRSLLVSDASHSFACSTCCPSLFVCLCLCFADLSIAVQTSWRRQQRRLESQGLQSNLCFCLPCGSRQPWQVLRSCLRPNQIAFGAVRAFVSLWVQSQSGCCSVWRSGIVSHIGPTCTFVRCPFALIFVASAFDADLSW